MRQADFETLMRDVFENEIMYLREQGQKEYAQEADNAFANFERVAADLDLEREEVLWVYAMKHKDGIAAYLKGHESQREDVRGRINDLIVYLFILRGMIEDSEPDEFAEETDDVPPTDSSSGLTMEEIEEIIEDLDIEPTTPHPTPYRPWERPWDNTPTLPWQTYMPHVYLNGNGPSRVLENGDTLTVEVDQEINGEDTIPDNQGSNYGSEAEASSCGLPDYCSHPYCVCPRESSTAGV